MKITIKNFQKKVPIYPKRIKNTILKVFSGEGVKKSGEITVCFIDDKKIKGLNRKFLHRYIATDVLAFDLSGEGNKKVMFADIAISTEAAIRNAKVFKVTPLYELSLYVIHGVLHLLGYRDRSVKQKIIMRKKEKKYVNS